VGTAPLAVQFSAQLCAGAGVCLGSSYIGIMNWQRHLILVWFTLVALAGAALRADVAAGDRPYAPIITRNVFGLVPIPTNAPVDPATLTPPPKITPNGIMTLFGKVQVLFKVAGVAHPGQPPKDESYVMSAGDRQDEVEVVKIDEPTGTITFNNHGVVQELALEKGTATGGESAVAAAAGGAPPPGFAPGGGDGGLAPTAFGGRFGRGRPRPDAGNPNATPDLGSAPVNNHIYNPAAEAGAQVSPEEQVILIEAQRQKYLQEGNPIARLLPPTPLTPKLEPQQ
jgi:hypothetical protein